MTIFLLVSVSIFYSILCTTRSFLEISRIYVEILAFAETECSTFKKRHVTISLRQTAMYFQRCTR